MGNRIPRKAQKLEVTFLLGNHEGETYTVERDKWGSWIGRNEDGRYLCIPVGIMRNERFVCLKVIE